MSDSTTGALATRSDASGENQSIGDMTGSTAPMARSGMHGVPWTGTARIKAIPVFSTAGEPVDAEP